MFLLLSINFCHSQIVQKIGGDSVVIISLQQADNINVKFSEGKKTVESLKDSISILKISQASLHKVIESLNKDKDSLKIDAEKYKTLHKESKDLFIKREQYYYKQTKLHTITYLVLAFSVAIFTLL